MKKKERKKKMAIYMPPLCRKKRVQERYNPDTFRVISHFAEETHKKYASDEENKPSEWRRQWLENEGLALPDIYNRKTEVLPQSAPDFRANKPHPGSCGFLRHNVRLLNEPICSVYTNIPDDGKTHWWPSRVSNEPLQVPPRTNDTVYRVDFLNKEEKTSLFGSTRHTSNPNKEPALGTVPVNFLRPKDGSQRFYKEKVSYEHMYNSRLDPNYPIRGKRHGSFVWDPMSADATKKFINHYSVISVEEGARRQEVMEADRLANEAAKLLEDTNVCELPQAQTDEKIEAVKEQNSNAEKNGATQAEGSKEETPANSGKSLPKQPSSKTSSKPTSPKKVPSRKTSVANGENISQKCKNGEGEPGTAGVENVATETGAT